MDLTNSTETSLVNYYALESRVVSGMLDNPDYSYFERLNAGFTVHNERLFLGVNQVQHLLEWADQIVWCSDYDETWAVRDKSKVIFNYLGAKGQETVHDLHHLLKGAFYFVTARSVETLGLCLNQNRADDNRIAISAATDYGALFRAYDEDDFVYTIDETKKAVSIPIAATKLVREKLIPKILDEITAAKGKLDESEQLQMEPGSTFKGVILVPSETGLTVDGLAKRIWDFLETEFNDDEFKIAKNHLKIKTYEDIVEGRPNGGTVGSIDLIPDSLGKETPTRRIMKAVFRSVAEEQEYLDKHGNPSIREFTKNKKTLAIFSGDSLGGDGPGMDATRKLAMEYGPNVRYLNISVGPKAVAKANFIIPGNTVSESVDNFIQFVNEDMIQILKKRAAGINPIVMNGQVRLQLQNGRVGGVRHEAKSRTSVLVQLPYGDQGAANIADTLRAKV